MNVTDLVRVHEAGIAHHVAAVRQVYRQNCAATVLNRAASVIVKPFVSVGWNIAAGEVLFDPFQELHVDGHNVFGAAVLWAVFDHPDLTVTFDDLSLYLTDLLVEKV